MASTTDRGLGAFAGSESVDGSRYPNPFYGVPMQYMPLNIDGMIWWANHFLFRNGFYAAALRRVADYFVTTLQIEVDDDDAKKQYEDALEKLKWRITLKKAGANLLAFGNEYISINQGFNRFLRCPKCGKITDIDKIPNFGFIKGAYTASCMRPTCTHKGSHEVLDEPNKDIERIKVIHWNVKEIKLRHEDTTDQSEYYWDIPQDYISKVSMKNNKFYSKVTPKVVFDCAFSKKSKMMALNPKNFIHLKFPSPTTIRTDGRAVPPCMFMFDDLFSHQTLKRAQEVICNEDIVPFRVISMESGGTNGAHPIFQQEGGFWKSNVDKMIEEHRRDPGAYHTFAFPIQYQTLGGDGTKLVPADLIAQSQANILSALSVPQELFNMTLQTQAVGPALRLFENSWTVIPATYNELLQHWGSVIGKIRGLPEAKISLLPITLADDMERKSVIGQLVSANAIARSELLKLYGLDHKDQVRKQIQEERDRSELQTEEQKRQALEQQNDDSIFNQQGQQTGSGQGSSPGDVDSNAQQIAQELYPQDGAARRKRLQEIKGQDDTLYSRVKQLLEEMDQQGESQGGQQAKQQAAQSQQGTQPQTGAAQSSQPQ